jgi:hypothetical protein
MEYGILGLMIPIADIYSIYKVWTSGTSTAAKLVWTLVIALLPVIGLWIWLLAGPRGAAANV